MVAIPAGCVEEVPVLFIMTSNAPDTMYSELLNSYQQTFSAYACPYWNSDGYKSDRPIHYTVGDN